MSKTIVITGAGDGLGRACARRFARDGHKLVLLSRTLSKVQAVADELGAPHVAIGCDVGDPASVEAAFAQVASDNPKIDVLINNAGIYEPFTLEHAPVDLVQRMIATNLAGPIYCGRAAVPLLRGGGHLINVTSESSQMRMPMLWLYAATKVAVEYMGEDWARDLDRDGIRVTTVRAGQMMDETKTGSSWPMETAIAFARENAKVGIHIRERPISHYNSAAEAIRSVVDMPADLHVGLIALNARQP